MQVWHGCCSVTLHLTRRALQARHACLARFRAGCAPEVVSAICKWDSGNWAFVGYLERLLIRRAVPRVGAGDDVNGELCFSRLRLSQSMMVEGEASHVAETEKIGLLDFLPAARLLDSMVASV